MGRLLEAPRSRVGPCRACSWEPPGRLSAVAFLAPPLQARRACVHTPPKAAFAAAAELRRCDGPSACRAENGHV